MEGCFTIVEPEEGEVSISTARAITPVAIEVLPSSFREVSGHSSDFGRVPVEEALKLTLQRFDTVKAAPIVLDNMAFYASVEENGTILSVLELDVPSEAGNRLSLDAVKGADLWSLYVNGKKRTVYGSETAWIIPLDAGKSSHVSLAYIQKTSKLKLQGRLTAQLPNTGIPARHITVCMALPERVELLSLEGPVSPSSADGETAPTEITGRRYYFARSYYSGDGMLFNLAYKEPVQRN